MHWKPFSAWKFRMYSKHIGCYKVIWTKEEKRETASFEHVCARQQAAVHVWRQIYLHTSEMYGNKRQVVDNWYLFMQSKTCIIVQSLHIKTNEEISLAQQVPGSSGSPVATSTFLTSLQHLLQQLYQTRWQQGCGVLQICECASKCDIHLQNCAVFNHQQKHRKAKTRTSFGVWNTKILTNELSIKARVNACR